jgi:hypothetical protein
METFTEPNHERMEIADSEFIYNDPFIKEFLAFCKINGLENRAIELIDKKIKEKRRFNA